MDLERIIDVAFPKDNNHNMQRDRPYKGQQHTDQGERGLIDSDTPSGSP